MAELMMPSCAGSVCKDQKTCITMVLHHLDLGCSKDMAFCFQCLTGESLLLTTALSQPVDLTVAVKMSFSPVSYFNASMPT